MPALLLCSRKLSLPSARLNLSALLRKEPCPKRRRFRNEAASTMTIATQTKIWGIVLLVFVLILITLKTVLLPFVAGMAIAYFLDPTCDRLESWGCSRTMATSIVTAIFGLSVVIILILVVPIALNELLDFFASLPEYIVKIQE